MNSWIPYTDWEKYDKSESLECGYLVTAGHEYCRGCGGGGASPDSGDTCEECNGMGEFEK